MAVPTKSKQDRVYAQMRDRLVKGVFPPGHRINAAEVARALGTSTIPVREALRRLEAEGWLEHVPNAGMRVTARTTQVFADMMTPFSVLAGFATAEAADALRDGNGLNDLRQINAGMGEALNRDDYVAMTELNMKFHQRIFAETPNPEVRRTVLESWERLNMMRRALYGGIPLRATQSVAEHYELIVLLERRAEHLEVEVFVRAHVMRTVAASRLAPELSERPGWSPHDISAAHDGLTQASVREADTEAATTEH